MLSWEQEESESSFENEITNLYAVGERIQVLDEEVSNHPPSLPQPWTWTSRSQQRLIPGHDRYDSLQVRGY